MYDSKKKISLLQKKFGSKEKKLHKKIFGQTSQTWIEKLHTVTEVKLQLAAGSCFTTLQLQQSHILILGDPRVTRARCIVRP